MNKNFGGSAGTALPQKRRRKRLHLTLSFPLSLACGVGAVALLAAGPAAAQNLVTDGGFEAGNFNSFQTGYTKVFAPGPNSLVPEGTVAIGSNAANYHSLWANVPAHSGANYLIANGAPGDNVDIWRQTVATVVGQRYDFSFYATNVCCNGNFSGPNGAPVLVATNGGVFSLSGTATGTGAWIRLAGSFVATSASTTLNIYNDNSQASGNDFGLDDISLTAVPEPGSWLLLVGGFAMQGVAMRRRAKRRQRLALA